MTAAVAFWGGVLLCWLLAGLAVALALRSAWPKL